MLLGSQTPILAVIRDIHCDLAEILLTNASWLTEWSSGKQVTHYFDMEEHRNKMYPYCQAVLPEVLNKIVGKILLHTIWYYALFFLWCGWFTNIVVQSKGQSGAEGQQLEDNKQHSRGKSHADGPQHQCSFYAIATSYISSLLFFWHDTFTLQDDFHQCSALIV